MILDGHIHIEDGTRNDGSFQKVLQKTGIDGGIVISLNPKCFGNINTDYSNKERLVNLFSWVEGNSNLYPFYWIDPVEEDADEQVDMAEDMGVKGYKVICSNHYPSDRRAMRIYKRIADSNKPILFHSGILWDGKPSSKYNRPLEFEDLLEIDRLKFYLAHISWPWCDENIALYGKILNAYARRPDLSVEMFIDITPGTPPIYREEALTKLFKTGYDVENNIIFGTDCSTKDYNYKWAREWMNRDDGIYGKLGINEGVKKKIYSDNLKRFIGISDTKVSYMRLVPGE